MVSEPGARSRSAKSTAAESPVRLGSCTRPGHLRCTAHSPSDSCGPRRTGAAAGRAAPSPPSGALGLVEPVGRLGRPRCRRSPRNRPDAGRACAWMHKLRRAMVRPDRDLLEGLVEVDETYFGGTANSLVTTVEAASKWLIVIAVEMPPGSPRPGPPRSGPGRDRRRRCAGSSNTSWPRASPSAPTAGTVYKRLTSDGYRHTPINVVASGDPAHIALPGVHRVAVTAEAMARRHPPRRQSATRSCTTTSTSSTSGSTDATPSRGLLFYRLLQQAVAHRTPPTRDPHRLAPRPQHVGVTGVKRIPHTHVLTFSTTGIASGVHTLSYRASADPVVKTVTFTI